MKPGDKPKGEDRFSNGISRHLFAAHTKPVKLPQEAQLIFYKLCQLSGTIIALYTFHSLPL